MDKAELLHHRAAILAGEIKRLAAQAKLEGEHEVYAQLKGALRELPHAEGTLDHALSDVRARLAPEVGAALRPGIERQAKEEAATRYQTRQEALDLREAGMDHQPKRRGPWIALGATLGVWGTIIVALLT